VPSLGTDVLFQLFDHATHDPFSHLASFRPHTVTCRALQHSLGTARRRSFPPLNLHRARVRRKSRAASFKSLYRKRANTPCSCTRLALRASDTSLTTPAGSRVFCSGSSIVLAHHNLLRNLRSCSADDSPQLAISFMPNLLRSAPCHFIDSVLPTKHLFGHSGPRWFIRTPCLSGRRVAHSTLRSLQSRTIYRPGIPARVSPLFCRSCPRRQNSL